MVVVLVVVMVVMVMVIVRQNNVSAIPDSDLSKFKFSLNFYLKTSGSTMPNASSTKSPPK